MGSMENEQMERKKYSFLLQISNMAAFGFSLKT